jgi:hypothetical protein
VHDPCFCSDIVHRRQEGLHHCSKMCQLLLIFDLLRRESAIVVRMEGRLVEVFVFGITSLAAPVSVEMRADIEKVGIGQDAWYEGEHEAYPPKASEHHYRILKRRDIAIVVGKAIDLVCGLDPLDKCIQVRGTRLDAEKRLGLLYRAMARVLAVGRRLAGLQALGRFVNMIKGKSLCRRSTMKIGAVKEEEFRVR